MNKPDLQLNLYDLISCSCWDAVILHVGMQLFLERVTREYTLYGPKIDALL